MTDIAIIGAGSWGTALALALAPRTRRLRLWAYDEGLAEEMEGSRENTAYLPGFRLPDKVEPTNRLATALDGADHVLLVVPSQHLRTIFRSVLASVRGSEVFISATKGLERATLLRMSEVLLDEIGTRFPPAIAVLSGPTFAREIANGEPAAVVISSTDVALAGRIQQAWSGPSLRLYTNCDPTGVEIGAALKNVIAIAAGIVQGLGLGNNTTAALITRGLSEITRLAVALGGRPETLAGLAGLGDLVLTCTGDLSRNRRLGIELARGRRLEEILASARTVAEGVETTFAAVELARRVSVDMPIIQQMNCVLREGKSPREGIRDLMERGLRSE